MNKHTTLADRAFAIFEQLLDAERLITKKSCVGLGLNPDRPETWPFDFIEIDYDTKTAVFSDADYDMALTEEQLHVLWEIGFIEAIVEYIDGSSQVYSATEVFK